MSLSNQTSSNIVNSEIDLKLVSLLQFSFNLCQDSVCALCEVLLRA